MRRKQNIGSFVHPCELLLLSLQTPITNMTLGQIICFSHRVTEGDVILISLSFSLFSSVWDHLVESLVILNGLCFWLQQRQREQHSSAPGFSKTSSFPQI